MKITIAIYLNLFILRIKRHRQTQTNGNRQVKLRILAAIALVTLTTACQTTGTTGMQPISTDPTTTVVMYEWKEGYAGVREAFAETDGYAATGHRNVRAFAQPGKGTFGNVCPITMPRWGTIPNTEWETVHTHEMLHCLYGDWHDRAGKAYHN